MNEQASCANTIPSIEEDPSQHHFCTILTRTTSACAKQVRSSIYGSASRWNWSRDLRILPGDSTRVSTVRVRCVQGRIGFEHETRRAPGFLPVEIGALGQALVAYRLRCRRERS
jgi:hypothetical protein